MIVKDARMALGIVTIGLAFAFLILAVPQSSGDDGLFVASEEDTVGHWYLAYSSRYSPDVGYSVRTAENDPEIGLGDMDIFEMTDGVLHGRYNDDFITGVYDTGQLRLYGDGLGAVGVGMFRDDGTMVVSNTGSSDGIGWTTLDVFTKSVDRSMISLPGSIDITGEWTGQPTFSTNGVFGSTEMSVDVGLQYGNLFDAILTIDDVDYCTSGVVYGLGENRMMGRISSGMDHTMTIEIVSGRMLISIVGTDADTGAPFCALGELTRDAQSQPEEDNRLENTVWRCTSSYNMDALGKIMNDIQLYSIEFHANVKGVLIGTWTYGNESVPVSANIYTTGESTYIRITWLQNGIETRCSGTIVDDGNTMILYEFKTVDGIPSVCKSALMISSNISAPDIIGHWYISHTVGHSNDGRIVWDVMKDETTVPFCDFDIYRVDDSTLYGLRNGVPFIGYYCDGIISINMMNETSKDVTMGWIENDGTLTTMNTYASSSGDRHISYSTFTKVRGTSSLLDTDIDITGTWYTDKPVRINSDGTVTPLYGKTMEITDSQGGMFTGIMEQNLNDVLEVVPIHGIVLSTTWGYIRGVMMDDNDVAWGIDMRYGTMIVSCIGGYVFNKPSFSVQKNYVLLGEDDGVDPEIGADDGTVWICSDFTIMREDGVSFPLDTETIVHFDLLYGNCYAGRLVYEGTEYALTGYTTHIGDNKVTRMVTNISEDRYGLGFGVYRGDSIDLTFTYESDGLQHIIHGVFERAAGATS